MVTRRRNTVGIQMRKLAAANPVEAAYIPQARLKVAANRLKNKATREENAAKKACAKAMQAASVSSFDFLVGNNAFTATLERPEATRICVRKLYTLVKNGELSLDDFFDCISASKQAVEETLGAAKVAALEETYRRGLDLIITPKE